MSFLMKKKSNNSLSDLYVNYLNEVVNEFIEEIYETYEKLNNFLRDLHAANDNFKDDKCTPPAGFNGAQQASLKKEKSKKESNFPPLLAPSARGGNYVDQKPLDDLTKQTLIREFLKKNHIDLEQQTEEHRILQGVINIVFS